MAFPLTATTVVKVEQSNGGTESFTGNDYSGNGTFSWEGTSYSTFAVADGDRTGEKSLARMSGSPASRSSWSMAEAAPSAAMSHRSAVRLPTADRFADDRCRDQSQIAIRLHLAAHGFLRGEYYGKLVASWCGAGDSRFEMTMLCASNL